MSSRHRVEALAAIYGRIGACVRGADDVGRSPDEAADTDAASYQQKYVAALEPDSERSVRFVRRNPVIR